MFILTSLSSTQLFSQRFLSEYDSTLFMRDTVVNVIRRFDNLFISGYMQPQFQVAQQKGINSYEGGNFQPFSDNRFMLRRARVKFDYRLPSKARNLPLALFTFQFEATERDVNVRDMFVRIYEPKKNHWSMTAGLVGRPYGYEVNLSSSFRETPERGRMSQILMPSERDLGAMITYEPLTKGKKLVPVRFDVGLFNGQGKSGPAEFDTYKDVISRLAIKEIDLTDVVTVSGGLSVLWGAWVQPTKYVHEMGEASGNKLFIVDSSLSNIGGRAERNYHGADAQVQFKHGWGKTELRGEYWGGRQPGTATTTVNPGTLPTSIYKRKFDGAFFYFLQNIINDKWELMVKYDWYDPNREVSEMEIGKPGTNLSEADIRYNTIGAGLTHYFNDNLKILAYYAMPKNEKTALAGFEDDVEDNVFTMRIQFRF